MKKDLEKQEQLISILYDFVDDQILRMGETIKHRGFYENSKPRKIYNVKERFRQIMDLFGYEITSIQ